MSWFGGKSKRAKGQAKAGVRRAEAVPESPAPAREPVADRNTLRPGTVLGKYKIVRCLGQGGMGAVYEAQHTGIGKAVALKTMRPKAATDPNAEARFLREAASASRLSHPNVVEVTDYGTDRGVHYLVMELLRGDDLSDVIAREPGKVPEALVADVMLAVCAGVYAAHEGGVIHRDLKPQNIFLSKSPLGDITPKVLDFGVSKIVDQDLSTGLTNTGTVMGTTQYLAPEQVAGETIDVRSDQYSLGVILYETLTGRRPHDGDTVYAIMHSIGEGKFEKPRRLRRDLSAEMEAIVVRAMSRKPKDRYESVYEMGRALLPLASGKQRVIWADYYERAPQGRAGRGSGAARDSGPSRSSGDPARAGLLGGLRLPAAAAEGATVAIDSPLAPVTATRVRPRQAPTVVAKPAPAPAVAAKAAHPGDEPQVSAALGRPSRRGRGRGLALLVILVGGSVAAYYTLVTPTLRAFLPQDLQKVGEALAAARRAPDPPREPASTRPAGPKKDMPKPRGWAHEATGVRVTPAVLPGEVLAKQAAEEAERQAAEAARAAAIADAGPPDGGKDASDAGQSQGAAGRRGFEGGTGRAGAGDRRVRHKRRIRRRDDRARPRPEGQPEPDPSDLPVPPPSTPTLFDSPILE